MSTRNKSANHIRKNPPGNLIIEMPTPPWRHKLLISSKGTIRALLANAITALSCAPQWKGVLAFNDFAVRAETKRETPWGKPAGEPWSDNDDRRTAEWLQHEQIAVNTGLASEAVQTVAMKSRFHPVRQYLESLEWDGTSRLGSWPTTYLGAQKEIQNEFGRLWMISAVARAMKAGVKADCCLVLEGQQGIMKSTALRTLAGDWFSDHIPDLTNKDAVMQCHGVWILEIAELDSLMRTDTSRIKAFMSTAVDRIRLPYGRNIVELPRDSVFAGTVNQDSYLRDETGARRFWPVQCTKIDIKALERDRDQLWAEAFIEYSVGNHWWLEDQDLIDVATEEQNARYQPGPWDDLIATWIREPKKIRGFMGKLESTGGCVRVEDILIHCIGKEKTQWNRSDQMQVSAALKRLGWGRFMRDGQRWYRPEA